MHLAGAFRKAGIGGGGRRKSAARSIGFVLALFAMAGVQGGCAWFEAPVPPVKPRFVFSPYQDLALGPPAAAELSDHPAVTLAFATGECGDERIHGVPGSEWARANLGRLEQAGIDFIVSTGGEGGAFTCSSDAGMRRFIADFDSPRLIGFDFDVEATQTPEQIDSLMQRMANVQVQHPFLRWSFTLGSFAAGDGSRANLNQLGTRVVESAQAHRVQSYLVNLMAMDYGQPDPSRCIVVNGACDMGGSALQAARNLHEARGVPYERIELTVMLGANDSPGNVFQLADAAPLAHFVRENGLAGLHYWSLDRDNPCTQGKVADNCSGLPDVPPGAFARAFAANLK